MSAALADSPCFLMPAFCSHLCQCVSKYERAQVLATNIHELLGRVVLRVCVVGLVYGLHKTIFCGNVWS